MGAVGVPAHLWHAILLLGVLDKLQSLALILSLAFLLLLFLYPSVIALQLQSAPSEGHVFAPGFSSPL